MKTFKDIDDFSQWSLADRDDFTVRVIKGLVMDAVRNANSGHTGGPMSSADFATLLYSRYLRYNPDDPEWINRDRFVLSAGHESMLLYSLLYLTGRLNMEDLKQFRQLHSRTPGHPEAEIPGVECTTGPLGQGFAMGVGMALAEEKVRSIIEEVTDASNVTENLSGHRTYVLASDGDLQEPVALGAAALAAHWGLSKLTVFYDKNDVQISGETSRSDSVDVHTIFQGLGWDVYSIDGHNHDQICRALEEAEQTNRPSVIIGQTQIAKGAHSMEGSEATHGAPLPQDEIDATKAELGLPEDPFYCPSEIMMHMQRRNDELRQDVTEWKQQVDTVLSDPEPASIWNMLFKNTLPDLDLPEFPAVESIATRKAFGITLELFAQSLPHLVGGSADLEPSNQTAGFAKTYGDFTRENRQGRNLAFGVREFPMAAIMNGLALHGGIVPFGGTFLVFSDYSRPAIRLGALQNVRVLHEFTHDSFFVGEDGPTHQPVEHAMALRAIPNLQVFRPADARETGVCFKMILENEETPGAFLLTRQKVPVLDMDISAIEAGVRRGGYVVREPENDPEIILIGTGSEVSLALAVAAKMVDKQIRVVSLPCWEIFDKQSDTYRNQVIPSRGCLKVSLEAGVTQGWERYVGPGGVMIGLDHFGASAPGPDLAQEFGFTAEAVEMRIREALKQLL